MRRLRPASVCGTWGGPDVHISQTPAMPPLRLRRPREPHAQSRRWRPSCRGGFSASSEREPGFLVKVMKKSGPGRRAGRGDLEIEVELADDGVADVLGVRCGAGGHRARPSGCGTAGLWVLSPPTRSESARPGRGVPPGFGAQPGRRCRRRRGVPSRSQKDRGRGGREEGEPGAGWQGCRPGGVAAYTGYRARPRWLAATRSRRPVLDERGSPVRARARALHAGRIFCFGPPAGGASRRRPRRGRGRRGGRVPLRRAAGRRRGIPGRFRRPRPGCRVQAGRSGDADPGQVRYLSPRRPGTRRLAYALGRLGPG